MKAKTLIELLTLSTNIYMISKDEKFMNNLKEMTDKGREKVSAIANEWMDDDEEKLLDKLMHKAHEAKEELEHKIGEVAEKVYAKMNIAHTQQVTALEEQLDAVKRELALAEARIITLESNKQ
jgi:polyhydroxyalkanoate synthesis regulator phasin